MQALIFGNLFIKKKVEAIRRLAEARMCVGLLILHIAAIRLIYLTAPRPLGTPKGE